MSQKRYYSARILSVIEGFQRDNNNWATSAVIYKYVPELTKPQLHNLVSSLTNAEHILERQQTSQGRAGYEYRLSPAFVDYKSPAPEAAAPATPVTLVKEGVKSREGKYIKWTKQEQWDIAVAVAVYRKSHPVGVVESINAVQPMMVERGTLKAERKRYIQGLTGIQWIFPLLEKADKKIHAAATQKPVETPAAPPLVQEAAPPYKAPPAPLSTEGLIGILVTRFQQGATKVLADAIDYGVTRAIKSFLDSAQGQKLVADLTHVGTPRHIHHPVKHNPEPEQTPRLNLTRVLVAGLRQNEKAPILAEFKDALDVRIWCEGDSSQSLKNMTRVVDKTVLVINRLSHPEKDIIRDVMPTEKCFYVRDDNGPRGVVGALTKIFAAS